MYTDFSVFSRFFLIPAFAFATISFLFFFSFAFQLELQLTATTLAVGGRRRWVGLYVASRSVATVRGRFTGRLTRTRLQIAQEIDAITHGFLRRPSDGLPNSMILPTD